MELDQNLVISLTQSSMKKKMVEQKTRNWKIYAQFSSNAYQCL